MLYTKEQIAEIFDKIDKNELIKVSIYLEVNKEKVKLDFNHDK